MKFNKWTYGLAAVGAVSLASAARADEAHMSQLNTALSSTTISGYVDVAAQYNNGQRISSAFATAPQDGFSLNTVTISLDKPLDESAWASGYHVDMNAGTAPYNIDAFNFNTTASHFAIRQAYVALRTPLGNGIDWKFGAFDTILGYESATPYANPNYTRSVGWGIEPTSYVGLLGTYKACDVLTVNAGIANANFTTLGGAGFGLSTKSFLASAVLTAPESFGIFKGATLNIATAQALQSGAQNNYYIGLTLPTPIKSLAVGLAFDALQNLGEPSGGMFDVFGAYATYQATDKLGLALRGEFYTSSNDAFNGEEITATMSYNLWANVVSRIEARWNHAEHSFNNVGNGGLTGAGYDNDLMLALNIIYKF